MKNNCERQSLTTTPTPLPTYDRKLLSQFQEGVRQVLQYYSDEKQKVDFSTEFDFVHEKQGEKSPFVDNQEKQKKGEEDFVQEVVLERVTRQIQDKLVGQYIGGDMDKARTTCEDGSQWELHHDYERYCQIFEGTCAPCNMDSCPYHYRNLDHDCPEWRKVGTVKPATQENSNNLVVIFSAITTVVFVLVVTITVAVYCWRRNRGLFYRQLSISIEEGEGPIYRGTAAGAAARNRDQELQDVATDDPGDQVDVNSVNDPSDHQDSTPLV